MATPVSETAETSPISIPTRSRHAESSSLRSAAVGSTALVVCVLIVGITAVCIALALAGDPTSGAMIAFMGIVLGFIAACVFNRRWR